LLTQAGGKLRCPTMRLSRSPPVKNLRAFCVAARHLSFKFAADELCLTPSAVSHQMKELETLRVLAPALFANEFLIPRLEEFCEAHPRIDV
jgi:DNA-binding transcriptional LysR family regulator